MLRASLKIMIGVLLVTGCGAPDAASESPSATPQATASVAPSPDDRPVRLEKTVIRTKQGQRWEMEAEVVDWMDDAAQAKAQDVTWFLFNPQGDKTVKVESAGADVDMNTEIVVFTGEVNARRLDSEETLLVNHLVYNGKKRVFYGSEGVVWKREGIELSAETLTATAELDKVQLKGKVRGKSDQGSLSAGGDPSPAQVDR